MDYINITPSDEQLNGSLELYHSTCFYCNGYYGPNFGEPICGTCHDFMYAEDLEPFHIARSHSWFGEKDDGDSGNDEPSEDAGPSNRVNNNMNGELPLQNHEDYPHPDPDPEQPDEQMYFEEDPERYSPDPEPIPGPSSRWPQDRLINRLALLTIPRLPYELNNSTEDMSLMIPPEIWAGIFNKLDDISLLMASKVSPKWKDIILANNPNSKWEEYVKLRWPLFNPIYIVADWYSVYNDFTDSLPCKLCFMNLLIDLPEHDFPGLRSLRAVRLHKELKWIRLDPPEGIGATPLDELNYNWLARINGPPDSPYQGGVFYLNLKVPHDYPLKPPIVRFITKIIHPNISRHGEVCVDCLQNNWTLALTIPQILLSVQSLLTDPYLEASMETSIADLYKRDRQMFDKITRIWTWKYAMHDVLVH